MARRIGTEPVRRAVLAGLAALLAAGLGVGCAVLPGSDPLRVTVVDIGATDARGLELRLAITLRVQNPNDRAVEFDGIALDLAVNGRPLASGVSDQRGSVPRYGETVITVPVSISALDAVRQAIGLADARKSEPLPYVLSGKLSGGLFGTMRFSQEGTLGAGLFAPARR